MVVPWPPRYLVALCTTMSAPRSQRVAQVRAGHGVVDDQRHAVRVRHVGHGRDVEHVDQRVADGFAIHRAGVGPHRAAKLSGSDGSTKVVSMPRREKPMPSCPTVPPYSVLAATMWSPAFRMASSAVICAAMPLAQASAARAFSSDATRSSKTATVGLLMRL
jgi:hypothetical protein